MNFDNIIPLGDHCATAIILKDELKLRKKSYPFDWIAAKGDNIIDSNINYILDKLLFLFDNNNYIHLDEKIDYIVNDMIGNCFQDNNLNDHYNINNNIVFPHESGTREEIIEKYKRRFKRLFNDITSCEKNLYIIVSRVYNFDKNKLHNILEIFKKYNKDSKFLIILGENVDISNDNIIFKYINYDKAQYYFYDYTNFRPEILKYLSDFFN